MFVHTGRGQCSAVTVCPTAQEPHVTPSLLNCQVCTSYAAAGQQQNGLLPIKGYAAAVWLILPRVATKDQYCFVITLVTTAPPGPSSNLGPPGNRREHPWEKLPSLQLWINIYIAPGSHHCCSVVARGFEALAMMHLQPSFSHFRLKLHLLVLRKTNSDIYNTCRTWSEIGNWATFQTQEINQLSALTRRINLIAASANILWALLHKMSVPLSCAFKIVLIFLLWSWKPFLQPYKMLQLYAQN